ncbi:MarR family winged helix-turn-helix transcriptional regulator [Microbacterium sp. MPKO10]|uniref:MarR family winged helix-turn-helix transcriptional regulator n=1 Tax=Microbacterium sp. MPKO10 TaxID=2989818 RepID=UPI0022359004|nr:MarR family winged helix-turn-helix transcriptional regulator [Microbacterium sp. MPKO10]MCW4456678.1 MarR family winged helix-turn-helix transcriptional regulator [Microbacterium sp. MPKO10]
MADMIDGSRSEGDSGPEELIGELVVSAHRLTRLAAQALVDPQNPAVWRTVSALRSLGPTRLGELARQSRVTQPTMTKIVQHLVELGWASRVVDPDDARAQVLDVTESGVAALDEWRRALARSLAPYFADLSAEDVRVITRTLEIVNDRTSVGGVTSTS